MLQLSTIETKTFSLLKGLFKLDEIKEQFALAGGTSLALQVGHRKSIELDLFATKAFNVRDIELLLAGEYQNNFTFVNSSNRMQFFFLTSRI